MSNLYLAKTQKKRKTKNKNKKKHCQTKGQNNCLLREWDL